MPDSVRRTLVLALAAAALPGLAEPTAAQTADTIAEPLDAIVVTVTRTERRLSDLPATVTVIQRRELEMTGAASVADFLRQIPGVSQQRGFSPLVSAPATGAMTLRGLGGSASSRTLVLLDGMPILNPFNSWIQWSRIPMEHVERIEVVRGGAAGIWGNLALGGVINVITRTPTESGGSLLLRGGGLGTVNGTASGSWVGDGVTVLGLAEYADTDGYMATRPDLRGPVDQRAATSHGVLYGKVAWELSPSTTLHVDGSWFDWERVGDSPLETNAETIGLARARLSTLTDGGHAWTVSGHVTRQSYNALGASVNEARDAERPTSRIVDLPATAAGASVQWAAPVVDGHALTAGVDAEWIDGESNEQFSWSEDDGAFTRNRTVGGEALLAGLYAQDSWNVSRSLDLFLGGRVNAWRLSDGQIRQGVIATGETTTDETIPGRSVWTADFNVGFNHDLTDRLAWRGVAFSGFRAPTLNELYRPFRGSGNVVGAANAELDPERLIGGEIGADLRPVPGLSLSATLFWNRISDAIGDATIRKTGSESETIEPCGRVPANGVCRQRDNFGRVRSIGLETEASWRPTARWSVGASWIWNPTEVLEAPSRPDLVGTSLRRSAENQGKVRIAFTDPSLLNVAVTARYTGEMFDDDLNQDVIDDSFVVDLGVSRALGPRVDAFLDVENLFDTEYEVGRSGSGLVRIGLPRLVMVGARLHF